MARAPRQAAWTSNFFYPASPIGHNPRQISQFQLLLTMSTTWDSLPVELTLHICEHLVEDTCDLVSLMLTCHVLHHSAHSTLYRHNVKHQRSSALFWAARHGHIRTIQAVLDHGADVNMASNCRSLQGIASYFHRRYTYTFPEQQDLDLGSDMKDSQDLVDAEVSSC